MHTTGWEGELLYKQEVEFIAHFLSIYFFDVVDHLLIMCYAFLGNNKYMTMSFFSSLDLIQMNGPKKV